MFNKQGTIGWTQAFINVLLFWGISNAFIAYSTQILDVNKLVFTLATYASCSITLLFYTKGIYLSKIEIRRIDTWIYSTIMLLNFFITINLFSLTTATEASLIQRFSLVVGVLFNWIILLNKPSKIDLLCIIIIFANICYIIANLNIENHDYLYILMFLSGLLQSIRIFSIEFHKTDKGQTSIKNKCAIIGYTMTIITSFLFIITAFLVWSSTHSNNFANIITLNDVLSFKSIVCGFIMGIFIYVPLRFLEFSAVSNIKTENYLIITSLSFISTLFWEVIISLTTNTLPISEISLNDIIAGLIITVCSFAIFINKKVNNRRYKKDLKNYVNKSLNVEDIEETRDIIANTLEHFKSDINKSAKALNIEPAILKTILEDNNKVLAFKTHILRQVAAKYRKNVANSDALTGLLNRNGFMTALKAATHENENLSLFFIDLNKFKPVNDTYGHEAGDSILQEVGQRLKKLFPEKSLITRLGGDEYCILLLGVNKITAEQNIKTILQTIEQDFTHNGNLINVSASIGLASYPEDTQNAEDLLDVADKQMYINKSER